MNSKTYDPSCADLAEMFLDDMPEQFRTDENVTGLAIVIQIAVEEFLSHLEDLNGERDPDDARDQQLEREPWPEDDEP